MILGLHFIWCLASGVGYGLWAAETGWTTPKVLGAIGLIVFNGVVGHYLGSIA